MSEMECVAGCNVFSGGERRHHEDCPHYPESLTKLWHDREAELLAEIERLRAASKPALGDKTKAVEYEKEGARETYKEVVGSDVGRTMTVSKHVATNHVHLRNVIAEADEQCPRAADTIRWMLWHNVLRVNRIGNMVAESPASSSQSAGWIYRSPDTGTEISDNHPIDSGECPDAENVREASASELRQVLQQTWEAHTTADAARELLSDEDALRTMSTVLRRSTITDGDGKSQPLFSLLSNSGEAQPRDFTDQAVSAALRAIASPQATPQRRTPSDPALPEDRSPGSP